MFVEASVHDAFVDAVVSDARKMKIGDPLDRSTVHGPQNHKAHFDKLVAYVEVTARLYVSFFSGCLFFRPHALRRRSERVFEPGNVCLVMNTARLASETEQGE